MQLGIRLTVGLVVILGSVGALVWSRFRATLHTHRTRIVRGSHILSSPLGSIEYAVAGQGLPVFVVHGAGGGFDQGVSAGSRLVKAGYQIIAPSRFGYLRSSTPDDASPAQQAEAFAILMDELNIARAPVVGMSVGALSALQFAVRHPERCRSLTLLVPAASAVTSAQGPLPEQGPVARAVTAFLVKSDFLYWLGLNLAPLWMIRSVLATDPTVVAAATPEERQRAYGILWNLLPISARSAGLLNDSRFASAPQGIAVEQIRAPTLVISLEDDFYRTLAPARVIAATVPGARLIVYPSGGHAFVGHDADVFAVIDAFIRQH